MNNAEHNPKLWDYDAALQELDQGNHKVSASAVDELVQKCVGCVAARVIWEPRIDAQTIARCGDVPTELVKAGLERGQKADTRLVYKVGPDSYSPTFTVRRGAQTPEDCPQITSQPNKKVPEDPRTISEKYLDLELLQCIGCVVYRNGGDVPQTFFRAAMFADCQSADIPQTGSALQRLSALPDPPIVPITKSKHQRIYRLTDAATQYVTMPPHHCDHITGFAKEQPLPKSKPVILTKNVGAQPHKPKPVVMVKDMGAQLRARQANRDKSVANCLSCIVQRHRSDYEGLSVPANSVQKCTGLTLAKTLESLVRLADSPKPPVTQKPGKRRRFTLTKQANLLRTADRLPDCQNIASTDAPSVPEVMVAAYAEAMTDDEVTQQKIIARLQRFLVEQIIDISCVTNTSTAHGFSYIYDKRRRQFVIGDTLRAESPGMRQAFLYTFGLDALIYGEPLDATPLKEELQLRPTDSIKALGRLVAYKIHNQKPPFEYTSPD